MRAMGHERTRRAALAGEGQAADMQVPAAGIVMAPERHGRRAIAAVSGRLRD